ncbi:MAG: hypothetical protein AB7O47_11885 [Flavobacteriales bacterium]
MKFLIILICFLTISFSCRKALEKPTWDVNLLSPLLNTKLTLNDLLPDSVLQVNPDTTLKLVYTTDIFSIDVDSLFKIPDTTITEIYSVPLFLIAAPGDSFYSNDEDKELNVTNGVELNYASIESGFIDLEIYSDIKEKVWVTYQISSATKNGDTLVFTELVDAATTQPAYFKKRVNISGYNLNLTGTTGNKTNRLVTKSIARVDTNGATVNITPGEEITFINTLVDVVPFYVKGYFGSQSYQFGPETTDFTVFDRIVDGTIDIEDVDVNISFENGIGVDAQLIINQFKTINTKNGMNHSLTHSIIGSPININRSTPTNSVPEVNYTSYSNLLTTSNSNIDNLIEIFPNQLQYDISLLINPFGNISGSNDFVYKKHPLKTKLNVEFPLSIVANNLTLVDTSDFNLELNSSGQILDGKLFIYADNGYPFSADLSIQLLDEHAYVLKTLPVINNIASASVGPDLRVISNNQSVLTVPLTKTDVDALYSSKKMVFKVTFNTTAQPQFIKIYDGYTMGLKVIADFAYQMN